MLVCETTDVTSTILTRAEHGVKPVVHGGRSGPVRGSMAG